MSIISRFSFRLPASAWQFWFLPPAGDHQRGFWYYRELPEYLTIGLGAVVFHAERRGRLACPLVALAS